MTKLEVQSSQVFFSNVYYSLPIVKSIFGQYLEICCEANALKNLTQLRHGRTDGRGRDRNDS